MGKKGNTKVAAYNLPIPEKNLILSETKVVRKNKYHRIPVFNKAIEIIKTVTMRNKYFLMMAFLLTIQASAVFSQDHRLVMIEHFTGASCGSCLTGNRYIDSLAKLNQGKLITLKYQVNIPSYDPMYNDDSAEIHQRMIYYGVYSAPTLFTDGNKKMYEFITQEVIDSLSQVPIHFHLQLQHAFNSGLDSMMICLITRSDSIQTFQTGKLHAFIALTEDSIVFLYPPGSNGEKIFKTGTGK